MNRLRIVFASLLVIPTLYATDVNGAIGAANAVRLEPFAARARQSNRTIEVTIYFDERTGIILSNSRPPTGPGNFGHAVLTVQPNGSSSVRVESGATFAGAEPLRTSVAAFNSDRLIRERTVARLHEQFNAEVRGQTAYGQRGSNSLTQSVNAAVDPRTGEIVEVFTRTGERASPAVNAIWDKKLVRVMIEREWTYNNDGSTGPSTLRLSHGNQLSAAAVANATGALREFQEQFNVSSAPRLPILRPDLYQATARQPARLTSTSSLRSDLRNFIRNPLAQTELFSRLIAGTDLSAPNVRGRGGISVPAPRVSPAAMALSMISIVEGYKGLGQRLESMHRSAENELSRCESTVMRRMHTEWLQARFRSVTCGASYAANHPKWEEYLNNLGEENWNEFQADREAAGLSPANKTAQTLRQSADIAMATQFQEAYFGIVNAEPTFPPSCRYVKMTVPRGAGTHVLTSLDALVDFSSSPPSSYSFRTGLWSPTTKTQLEQREKKAVENWPDESIYERRRAALAASTVTPTDCRSEEQRLCQDFFPFVMRADFRQLVAAKESCASIGSLVNEDKLFAACSSLRRTNRRLAGEGVTTPICPAFEPERVEIMAFARQMRAEGFPERVFNEDPNQEARRAANVWCRNVLRTDRTRNADESGTRSAARFEGSGTHSQK